MRKDSAKEHMQRTIKGLLESYIGGRKGVTPNHIIGQIRSAVEHDIFSPEECQKITEEMIECLQREIEENKLYPTVSKEEKMERLKLIKNRATSLLLT